MSNIFSLAYFEYVFIFHCITALFICVFIYNKGKGKITNLIFSLYSFAVFIWSLGFFMLINADSQKSAVFWRWFMDNGSILLPAFWLHFIYSILDINEENKEKLRIKVVYGISAFLCFLNFSDLFGSKFFAKSIEKKLIFDFIQLQV